MSDEIPLHELLKAAKRTDRSVNGLPPRKEPVQAKAASAEPAAPTPPKAALRPPVKVETDEPFEAGKEDAAPPVAVAPPAAAPPVAAPPTPAPVQPPPVTAPAPPADGWGAPPTTAVAPAGTQNVAPPAKAAAPTPAQRNRMRRGR